MSGSRKRDGAERTPPTPNAVFFPRRVGWFREMPVLVTTAGRYQEAQDRDEEPERLHGFIFPASRYGRPSTPRTTAYEASAPTSETTSDSRSIPNTTRQNGSKSLEPVLPEMGTEEQAGEGSYPPPRAQVTSPRRRVRTPRAPRSPGRGRLLMDRQRCRAQLLARERDHDRWAARARAGWTDPATKPATPSVTLVGAGRRPRQSRSANAITTTER